MKYLKKIIKKISWLLIFNLVISLIVASTRKGLDSIFFDFVPAIFVTLLILPFISGILLILIQNKNRSYQFLPTLLVGSCLNNIAIILVLNVTEYFRHGYAYRQFIDIFEMISKRMPTLKYEEFGTRTSFMCEYLGNISNYIEKDVYKDKNISLFKRLLLKLFMQKNRTKKYFLDFIEKYIKLEKTLPYKWESDQKEEKALNSGLFWWLQNPAGKVFFNHNNTNLKTVIFKSYAKKAMYDIVKISAELHLNYTPEIPVQEILNGLNTYKNNIDPCSGKPYIWNEQKQILYSIGTDRKDNQGQTNNYRQIENTDIAIPVILYVKID